MSWADLDPVVNQYIPLSIYPNNKLFTSICSQSHVVPSSAHSYQDYMLDNMSHLTVVSAL